MAAQLVVIRHAKAGEAPLDIERPLTERGHRDAAAIGQWLRERGIAPDRAVVSPARRAGQTWAGAAAALENPPAPVVDDRIYDNTLDLLLDIVIDTPEDVRTLVLVGHNPACAALAYELDDGTGDANARGELQASFPTSAIAVFELAGSWSAVDAGTGRLTAFGAPRG
jgi:phosphohistidine phosphatase